MPKILVIEDSEEMRRVLCKFFNLNGYDLLEAEDGNIGIEICRQDDIDVVITDIFMPGMDGIETIRYLQECHPQIKIIAISGGGISNLDLKTKLEFLALAKSMGASYTFTKPFEMDSLLQAVEKLMGKKKLRNSIQNN